MLSFLDKPLVRYPVYFGFGFIVFLLATAATFPDEQIKDIITVQLEKQLGNKYDVKIGDLDMWWFPGVSLEDVSLEERIDPSEVERLTAEEEEAGLEAAGPMKLTIPSVSARLEIIRSIMGGPTVGFQIELGGGDITGSFQQGSDARRVQIDMDGLDLRKTVALTKFLGVPFFGELSGEIDLELDPKRPMVTGGTVKLDGEKLTVGPATIKTDKFPPITYLEIPQTNFGTLDIDLGVGEGKAKSDSLEINSFSWAGRDIRGGMWGNFKLASRVDQTEAQVEMRMQLDENFVKKNNLGPLLNVAEVRRGKNKEWFGFRLYGRLKNIRFKGSPSSATGPKVGEAPSTDEKAGKE